MALSKRNSRPIVVNDQHFRWSFSAPYDSQSGNHRMNLTVQSEDGRGSKIIGTGQCPTGDGYLLEPNDIMTPSVVAEIIWVAIGSGWTSGNSNDWFVGEIENYFAEE